MSKHDVLTQAELDRFEMDPEFLLYLLGVEREIGIDRRSIRVLDWGCGRGRSVAKLCELGFDAYGVEIDSLPLKNGYELFSNNGWEPERRLALLDSGCRTPFEDRFFHFVFSDQVLEHVQAIDDVCRELERITTPGGIGLHRYPARYTILEGHLYMPFVHWLPKTRLRYLLILLSCALGVHPGWEGMRSMGLFQRAGAYYEYSVLKTYYRSSPRVRRRFESAGFAVEFVATKSVNLNRRWWFRRLMRVKVAERLAAMCLHSFKYVELLTRKELARTRS